MIHVKRSTTGIAGIVLAGMLTLSGCFGETPEGKANKAAGPQKSPAAGRIIAKTNTGKAQWLLIKNKGKSRTIYVTKAAWLKCQVDEWYANESCD